VIKKVSAAAHEDISFHGERDAKREAPVLSLGLAGACINTQS
jgi:hypothetical protein